MQEFGENITVAKQDEISIIGISNNLGYETADDLREAYNQIEVGKKLVIDLCQVTITTSRGMATLLSIIIEGEEKEQEFCLCNVSEPCLVIIDAMNILEYVEGLEILDNLEEGIAHFS